MDIAIKALKVGAFDFLSKPVDLQGLRELITNALKLSSIDSSQTPNEGQDLLLGSSDIMVQLRNQISKLARSQAPIYISGESGSGKELVANQIHQQGARSEAPFIPVNCGAIPKELVESEFFGHKKGSFTGAVADKEGLFEAANGGTLFLDEVADLPLDMQVKLLRAVQEKAVRAVGSHNETSIDVRILSATHKDLAQLVEKGEFRQDLFYRLNVIELKVPSLKQRKEDIPELTNYYLEKLSASSDTTPPTIKPEAITALNNYTFPGNVRELVNILERAITLCDENLITVEDLKLCTSKIETASEKTAEPEIIQIDDQITPTPTPTPTSNLGFELPKDINDIEGFLESIEKAILERTLFETRWNKTAAAKKLGISFRTMRYRLKKLELE